MAEGLPEIVLGRYRVHRALGHGGQGSVHAATRIADGLEVALKVVDADGDTVDRLRLEREGRVAKALESPHIVKALEVGTLPDRRVVVVFERALGEGLDEILRRGRFTTEELVRWATEILLALATVHEAGIVHRDVKPANVFVGGTERSARLLDFGIAHADATIGLTLPGEVVGTPKYMPPEQLRGLPDIDPRADLFALGVILYRHLAGVFPFEGETIDALLAKADAPPPPLRERRPDLPVRLGEIIDRAVLPDCTKRWASAKELRAALLPFSKRQEPARESTVGTFAKVALSLAIVLALVASFFLAKRLAPPSPSPSPSPSPRPPPAPIAFSTPATVDAETPLPLDATLVADATVDATPAPRPGAISPIEIVLGHCTLEPARCQAVPSEAKRALAPCELPKPAGTFVCGVSVDVVVEDGKTSVVAFLRPNTPCGVLTTAARECIESAVRGRDYASFAKAGERSVLYFTAVRR